MDNHFIYLRRAIAIFVCVLLCSVVSACGQSATSVNAPIVTTPTMSTAPSPTVDPLTLNICATCDVQQRRVQATAAATK